MTNMLNIPEINKTAEIPNPIVDLVQLVRELQAEFDRNNIEATVTSRRTITRHMDDISVYVATSRLSGVYNAEAGLKLLTMPAKTRYPVGVEVELSEWLQEQIKNGFPKPTTPPVEDKSALQQCLANALQRPEVHARLALVRAVALAETPQVTAHEIGPDDEL